jgi:drug/metabolite transporter (DMT)-like permease
VAVVLALASALSWGSGDFIAGRLSRRERVLVVLGWTQLVGLTGCVVLVLAARDDWPGIAEMWPALIAGAVGPLALGCFYRALAIGTMSVVAPISATAVAVPVFAGLATGDRPSAAALTGIVLAAIGIVLASREPDHDDAPTAQGSRTSVLLALGAALGFGIFLTALPAASDASVPWALLLARAVSATMCAAALTRLTGRRHPQRRDAPAILAVGVFDVGANALYAVASTKGLLSIVSVLGSLYPVMTVVLAWLLLHERLARIQQAGVVLAFAGVTLISL